VYVVADRPTPPNITSDDGSGIGGGGGGGGGGGAGGSSSGGGGPGSGAPPPRVSEASHVATMGGALVFSAAESPANIGDSVTRTSSDLKSGGVAGGGDDLGNGRARSNTFSAGALPEFRSRASTFSLPESGLGAKGPRGTPRGKSFGRAVNDSVPLRPPLWMT
jgi:hypothetical protein